MSVETDRRIAETLGASHIPNEIRVSVDTELVVDFARSPVTPIENQPVNQTEPLTNFYGRPLVREPVPPLVEALRRANKDQGWVNISFEKVNLVVVQDESDEKDEHKDEKPKKGYPQILVKVRKGRELREECEPLVPGSTTFVNPERYPYSTFVEPDGQILQPSTKYNRVVYDSETGDYKIWGEEVIAMIREMDLKYPERAENINNRRRNGHNNGYNVGSYREIIINNVNVNGNVNGNHANNGYEKDSLNGEGNGQEKSSELNSAGNMPEIVNCKTHIMIIPRYDPAQPEQLGVCKNCGHESERMYNTTPPEITVSAREKKRQHVMQGIKTPF